MGGVCTKDEARKARLEAPVKSSLKRSDIPESGISEETQKESIQLVGVEKDIYESTLEKNGTLDGEKNDE